MLDGKGRLFHRYADGEVAVPGFIDDYAFLVWGLLELYAASFEAAYLKIALQLTERMLEDFWDEKDGGFFFTPASAEPLPVRRKEVYDGAVPSGNAVAAINLLRLGRILGRPEFESRAADIQRAFANEIERFPSAYTHLLSTVEWATGLSTEVVIVGDLRSDGTLRMFQALRQRYLPYTVVIHRPAEEALSEIGRLAEYVQSMTTIDGRAAAYVCRDFHCAQPTTDVEQMLELLENGGKTQSGEQVNH
jgi:uncharacterized protein YyaL (SSP411 family)